MKIQHTNQTMIDSIASDNAWFLVDQVLDGMTIDEAVEAQVYGAMQEMFDEEEYDAPYDSDQLAAAYREALVERISESPTSLRHYASAHPESYIRDFDAIDPVNEDAHGNSIMVCVRVIEFDGKEYQVVFDDQEDFFFEAE